MQTPLWARLYDRFNATAIFFTQMNVYFTSKTHCWCHKQSKLKRFLFTIIPCQMCKTTNNTTRTCSNTHIQAKPTKEGTYKKKEQQMTLQLSHLSQFNWMPPYISSRHCHTFRSIANSSRIVAINNWMNCLCHLKVIQISSVAEHGRHEEKQGKASEGRVTSRQREREKWKKQLVRQAKEKGFRCPSHV